MFGFLWASICWLAVQRFEVASGVAEEREKAQ
jgi:hypothetical protein